MLQQSACVNHKTQFSDLKKEQFLKADIQDGDNELQLVLSRDSAGFLSHSLFLVWCEGLKHQNHAGEAWEFVYIPFLTFPWSAAVFSTRSRRGEGFTVPLTLIPWCFMIFSPLAAGRILERDFCFHSNMDHLLQGSCAGEPLDSTSAFFYFLLLPTLYVVLSVS